MSYEAERAKLISDFESEATTIRKNFNVAHKSKKSELDEKADKSEKKPDAKDKSKA